MSAPHFRAQLQVVLCAFDLLHQSSHDPYSGLINLLEWLIELRKKLLIRLLVAVI